MKRLIRWAVVLMCWTCMSRADEAKDSGPLSFEMTADLYSAYVWRGMVINDERSFSPELRRLCHWVNTVPWGRPCGATWI
jgi:hypothetical protein